MRRDFGPEPTFTLRARDHGSDEALITYHRVAKDTGGDPAHLAEVEKAIAAFRAYPVDVRAGCEPAGSVPGSSIPDPDAKPEKPAETAAPRASRPA